MLSKIHVIVSYIIILFGTVHLYFTSCLESFDTYALWFIGAGIAIIFAGFINLIKAKSSEKIVFIICILTNFLMTALFCVALFAMQKPQVYIGIVLSAAALILSLKKNSVHSPN